MVTAFGEAVKLNIPPVFHPGVENRDRLFGIYLAGQAKTNPKKLFI